MQARAGGTFLERGDVWLFVPAPSGRRRTAQQSSVGWEMPEEEPTKSVANQRCCIYKRKRNDLSVTVGGWMFSQSQPAAGCFGEETEPHIEKNPLLLVIAMIAALLR